jgi:hypothetical protein
MKDYSVSPADKIGQEDGYGAQANTAYAKQSIRNQYLNLTE